MGSSAKSKNDPHSIALEQARVGVAHAKDNLKGIEEKAANFHVDRRSYPGMTKATFFDALFNARDALAVARSRRDTALKAVCTWRKEQRAKKPLRLKRTT